MTSINSTSGISATPYSSAAKPVGKGEQRPMPPMPPAPEKKGDCSSSFVIPLYDKKDFKEIVITSEDVKVTFLVKNKELFNTPEETGKLIVIADLIRQLNLYVKGTPVSTVRIIKSDAYNGEYNISNNEITLTTKAFNSPYFLSTIAHEMGHAIDCSALDDGGLWEKLFIYSLGYGRYSIVNDAEPMNMDVYGHPFIKPGELFASAVLAYVSYPERFLECLEGPGLQEGTRNLGIAMFCYLRDHVFHGKVFGGRDPFAGMTAEFLAGSISQGDLDSSLYSALRDQTTDGNFAVCNIAADRLINIAANDSRYRGLIVEAFHDKDKNVRFAMVAAANNADIRDEWMIQLLSDATYDPDRPVRGMAAIVLKRMGIKAREKSNIERLFHRIF